MAGHEAVGVQHHHVFIGAAPACDEIADIAGFPRGVFRAMAVEDPCFGAKRAAQFEQGAFLGDPDVGIGGVRQEKPVEMRAEAGGFDILVDRAQRAEHPRRRLVIDRHDHGGAAGEMCRRRRRLGPADQQMEESHHAGCESQGDPGEIGQEQNQQRPFERADAAHVDDAVHLVAAPAGDRESAAEGDQTRQPMRPEATDRLAPFGRRLEAGKLLLRHGERRFRWHWEHKFGSRCRKRCFNPVLIHGVHR